MGWALCSRIAPRRSRNYLAVWTRSIRTGCKMQLKLRFEPTTTAMTRFPNPYKDIACTDVLFGCLVSLFF
jgi:hypothetical protein